MSKLFLTLVLCCIAIVAANDMIGEELFHANNELETIEFVDMSTKTSSVDRKSIRQELSDAFINSNLDDEYFQQQELLETQQEGTGYGEMKEIMEKVDALEKKIEGRLAEDLKYITEKRAYCQSTQKQYETDLSNLSVAIEKNNATIKNQIAKIASTAAASAASMANVRKWNQTIQNLSNQRQVDVDGYKLRELKRLKEINVLNACNNLVCTEFSDFKDTQICKDILTYGLKIQEYPGQASSESLDDLLKRAKTAGEDYEKKKAAEANRDSLNTTVSNALADKAQQDSIQANKGSVTPKIQQLLLLLQNGDLPPHIFKPARRIISMIRSGEAAKVHDAADPAASLTKADIKEMSLPESLVSLLRRITNDQKRETLDYIALLAKYHVQITQAGDAIVAEVSRQTSMAATINESNVSIATSKNDNIKRDQVATVTKDALNSLITNCRREKEEYDKRREGCLGELVNVQKLRSLLRTLQNSDLPKCPNDCTNTSQGKCVWQGLFGADSYCACAKGFWGASCEKRACPGPNGVMYQSNQQLACSARGTCADATGKCTCADSYYHGTNNSCEFKVCPGNGNCNGQGLCDNVTGLCNCYSKFYGSACQRFKCQASPGVLVEGENQAVCSGHGACDTANGKCKCSGMYAGEVCQYINCPNNCTGRGSCNQANGQCQCNSGFAGAQCEQVLCPENCNGGNGVCNLSVGRCSCYAGASGPSCRPVNWGYHTAVANPVDWTQNRGNWSWAMCPDNYLMYGLHRGSWDDNLKSITHIYCGKPMEGSNPVPVGQCLEVNVRSGWAYQNDSRMTVRYAECPSGYFMRGMLRSPVNGEATIDNIERFYCCRIHDNEAVTPINCSVDNWWSCLDTPAACGTGSYRWMTGLGRTHTNNKVWNIEEAKSCMFQRTATTRQLP